jgi:cytochrome c nitrite reductase small subunit
MRSAGPVLLGVSAGILAGLGLFTFGYAKGASYMTDVPDSCANCHVMREQLDAWRKSSHRSAAVCNDCHTPAGFLPKYFTKALNGVHHSLAFTTGKFPDNILITARNKEVTETACLKCHADVTDSIRSVRAHARDLSCIRCHRDVGHQH